MLEGLKISKLRRRVQVGSTRAKPETLSPALYSSIAKGGNGRPQLRKPALPCQRAAAGPTDNEFDRQHDAPGLVRGDQIRTAELCKEHVCSYASHGFNRLPYRGDARPQKIRSFKIIESDECNSVGWIYAMFLQAMEYVPSDQIVCAEQGSGWSFAP